MQHTFFFYFRIINKYLIVRNCLFCDFLQIVHNQNRMLPVHRSEYLLSLRNENYVGCQSLSMCKHCFSLLPRFPIISKLRHEPLNFKVAKFQGFCFGSLVILDVARCYLWLFTLYINIKIGKNSC